MENDAVGSKRCLHGVVNKFSSIIGLKTANEAKLSVSIGNEVNIELMNLRLALQRVRPAIVILATKYARNRRGPDITMNNDSRQSAVLPVAGVGHPNMLKIGEVQTSQ
jgi:hypothetical protein